MKTIDERVNIILAKLYNLLKNAVDGPRISSLVRLADFYIEF